MLSVLLGTGSLHRQWQSASQGCSLKNGCIKMKNLHKINLKNEDDGKYPTKETQYQIHFIGVR